MESPRTSLVDVSVSESLNINHLEEFKEMAEKCFTTVDFNEMAVTSIAAVRRNGRLMSGALIIDLDYEHITLHCFCTREAMQNIGFGAELLMFIQLEFAHKDIHVNSTIGAVEFYSKYGFELKNRSNKCCERNELKHMIWKNESRSNKKRRLPRQVPDATTIVTPTKKPSHEPGQIASSL